MDMSGVFNKLRNTLTNTVTEISAALPGNPLLREYDTKGQIGSAGPGYLWKIYSGFKKSTKAEVSIWILEKKSLEQYSKSDREVILGVFRRGCMQLAKLKHPRVLTVEHVVEESRESLVMCTEPIFGVLANLLGKHANMQVIPNHLKGYELNDVEIKYGLIQVSEGLDFLHNQAKIVHGNICPETIVSTKNGFWKICGFDFTLVNMGTFSEPKFQCKDWDTSIPAPSLSNPNYLAPEYITRRSCNISSDMFSLGILLYAIYHRGSTMFNLSHQNVYREMPKNVDKLQNLNLSSLGRIPQEVQEHEKMLLHPEPDVRPTAEQMSKLPFFDSVGVRTLQYLDSLLQRDNLQRSQFFKSLSNVLPQLPKRVQIQRLIPALKSELSNPNMIPFVLPNIFAVAEDCSDEEYLDAIFPCLIPVFKVHTPIQILFQMLKKMDFLLKRTPSHMIQAHVLPMICSALESTSMQIQDLSLSIIPSFSKQLDLSSMKSNILPKIRKIILEGSTTTLRVNGLVCMGKLMTSFDKWTVQDEVLIHLHLIKSREPGILMAMLGVYKIALTTDKLGITKEMMSGKSLPFLIPLAFEGTLNLKQFDAFMAVVKEMLKRIESEQRTKLEQISRMQLQESADLDFTKNNKGDASATNVDSIMASPTTNNTASSSPNMQALSLEEKQKLASMKAQESRMKKEGPVPLKLSTTTNKNNVKKPTDTKPKDLTSTLLMQHNPTSMTSQPSMMMTSQPPMMMTSSQQKPAAAASKQWTSSNGNTWNLGGTKNNNMNMMQQQNSNQSVFGSSMTSQTPMSSTGGGGGNYNNFMTSSSGGGGFGGMMSTNNSSAPPSGGGSSSLDTLMAFPSSQQQKPMMGSMMRSSGPPPGQQQSMMMGGFNNGGGQSNQAGGNQAKKLTQQDLLEFLG